MEKALAASILTHAAVFGATMHSGWNKGSPVAALSVPAVPTADIWAGDTVALSGGERLYDVALDAPTPAADNLGHVAPAATPPSVQAHEPAAPIAAAPPTPTPRAVSPARNPAPPAPPKPAKPAPLARPKHPDPVPPALDADSDIYAEDTTSRPQPPAGKPSGDISASPATAGGSPPEAAEAASAGSSTDAGGSFGVEGRAAARDIGRAFTRAIPPASDSDSVWATLPLGDAGAVEIAIDINDAGRIEGWRPLDASPPKHLMSMVRRTIALLEGGTYALRSGAVTRGVQVLKLSARVADAEALAGEALGAAVRLRFTYEAGRGTAAFTQQSGRRVEVIVQLLRVEAAG